MFDYSLTQFAYKLSRPANPLNAPRSNAETLLPDNSLRKYINEWTKWTNKHEKTGG